MKSPEPRESAAEPALLSSKPTARLADSGKRHGARPPRLVRQLNRFVAFLCGDPLNQRLRREAETAARKGDRGARAFLADLRHEQQLMA